MAKRTKNDEISTEGTESVPDIVKSDESVVSPGVVCTIKPKKRRVVSSGSSVSSSDDDENNIILAKPLKKPGKKQMRYEPDVPVGDFYFSHSILLNSESNLSDYHRCPRKRHLLGEESKDD